MLFSSGFFLMVFLPITMILYKLVSATKKSYSNLVLIVASLFFYSWGEPFFILILMGSIVINYFCGIGIETGKHRKLILILSLIVNIGILFIFKYLSFLAGEIASLFNINTLVVDISLPIGISFYTFQIMSYIFDVYYSKVPAQRNMAKLTLYIMMFPQLIAGPIVRYNDIVYQIDHREESFEKFYYGMLRFIVGLSKKVLIADFLGGIADKIFITSEYSAVPMITAWIGALAYTLEIYYDFSGYSDMAIGLGKCFGFDFKENFNYPYTACSLTDFWRRWHMSLTDWFRDYVYIPLGGNRVTPGRHILNLFCVWLLTGIWHGANWTFVVWGLIYFILLVIEKYLGLLKKLPKGIGWCITFLIVMGQWVIFRSSSLSKATSYIGAMLGSCGIYDSNSLLYFENSIIILAIAMAGALPFMSRFIENQKDSEAKNVMITIGSVILLVMCLLVVINGEYSPFIYFNF